MTSGTTHHLRDLAISKAKENYITREPFDIPHDEEDSILDLGNTCKRSGIHNLNRTGYQEDKCRNVLVRYCAHIPRNYQYKDGIQQIFLILREHLGDENLDLAGGVLYELIEVDCEHSDDPGAAFQRWKHDHLRRYADLELPHVPHMTTITSSIIPTKRLSQWRLTHPNRYPFVLSDSSPSTDRASVDPSCIRHRKAWMIDHTLYISSRNDGTRPLNSPNPKEFHERQWDNEYGSQGRLIEERDVPITSLGRPSETSPPGTADNLLNSSSHRKGLRRYSSGFSLLQRLMNSISQHRLNLGTIRKRRTWRPGALIFQQAPPPPEDKEASTGVTTVPLPIGCQVPNAIFARKYSLVQASDSLPESLALRHMPTAESKATDTILEAVTHGLLDKEQPWLFRGPFTPQLGFDGGLDYQWTPQEPTITFRSFHVDTLAQDMTDLNLGSDSEGGKLKRKENYVALKRTSTKRQGIVFGLAAGVNGNDDGSIQRSPNYTISSRLTYGDPSIAIPRGINGTVCVSLQADKPLTPTTQGDLMLQTSKGGESSSTGRQNCAFRRRDSSLFQNIEFTIPIKGPELENPTPHRKITMIELEPSHNPPISNHDHDRVIEAADAECFYDIKEEKGSASGLNEPAAHARSDEPCFCGVSQEMTAEKLCPRKFNERDGWKGRGLQYRQQGNDLLSQ
ncbi:uncharacterized protein GGS22DRAFT_200507 [Annulohypoxylon maeteangense]|uniref:uncharacterized protein n=1 Tax=Annulohypoxylon maeteangense TaxID=1927788 RepID=UPI0020078695|nr:uncharacterized protein GGS22DRAFT_200507 [Annulohypoxylon maeteangense]KAI0884836.1 hypothetical protein GGS22DRAFT_200507 [Annulohypoxylon maeteangense]